MSTKEQGLANTTLAMQEPERLHAENQQLQGQLFSAHAIKQQLDDKIARLQAAKRAALKENDRLRSALSDLLAAYLADVNPNDRNETAIEHARRHLEQEVREDG